MFHAVSKLVVMVVLFVGALSISNAAVLASHIEPHGRLWTYYAFGRPAAVSVFDLATDTLTVTFIPQPGNGRGVAYDPTDGNIWLSYLPAGFSGDGWIHKHPALGGPEITRIPEPGGSGGIGIGALDYDAEEKVLWAATYSPTPDGKTLLYKLDPSNGAVLKTCSLPFHIESGAGNDTLAVARPADLNGDKVVLTNAGEVLKTLYAVDANTCAVRKTYPLPVGVTGIDVDDVTGEMVAMNIDDSATPGTYVSTLYNLGTAPYNTIKGTFVTPHNPNGDAAEDISLEASAPAALRVTIDIKPGSSTNPITLKGQGVIPVAILSTATFDATQVNVSTICFGDAGDPTQRDCTEAHGTGHPEDVNGDGRLDLVLHFEIQQTGIDAGDTQACLTGETLSHVAIAGCDKIRVR